MVLDPRVSDVKEVSSQALVRTWSVRGVGVGIIVARKLSLLAVDLVMVVIGESIVGVTSTVVQRHVKTKLSAVQISTIDPGTVQDESCQRRMRLFVVIDGVKAFASEWVSMHMRRRVSSISHVITTGRDRALDGASRVQDRVQLCSIDKNSDSSTIVCSFS